MSKRRELAKQVAEKTQDAYSFDRYGEQAWGACCFMLLGQGYTAKDVEAIMRSKWTRWAGDMASKNDRVNSADLKRYMATMTDVRKAVAELVRGTFEEN